MEYLILFQKMGDFSNSLKVQRIVKVALRYLSFARNTLIVLITAIVAYIWFNTAAEVPFALSKNAMTGLPNITIPPFTVVTEERVYTIRDIIRELNIGIVVIPVVGILTNISIGKLGI